MIFGFSSRPKPSCFDTGEHKAHELSKARGIDGFEPDLGAKREVVLVNGSSPDARPLVLLKVFYQPLRNN